MQCEEFGCGSLVIERRVHARPFVSSQDGTWHLLDAYVTQELNLLEVPVNKQLSVRQDFALGYQRRDLRRLGRAEKQRFVFYDLHIQTLNR
jgi:hypothetical protein